MLKSWSLILVLVGWGGAVSFNDTAGILVDWGPTGTEKDLTVSGGLGDSTTTGATSHSTPFDSFDSEYLVPEQSVINPSTTPPPRNQIVSTTSVSKPSTVPTVSTRSTRKPLNKNARPTSDPRRPHHLDQESQGVAAEELGSASDHLAQVSGSSVFRATRLGNGYEAPRRGDDVRRESGVVVVPGEIRFQNEGGDSHRNSDPEILRPRYPVSSTTSSFSPTQHRPDSHSGSSRLKKKEGLSSSSSSFLDQFTHSSASYELPWSILLGLVVLSACTLACLSVQAVCLGRRAWKKWRDSPYMLERRIRRREAKVRWRAQKNEGGLRTDNIDIEMQPLTESTRNDRPFVLGSAPQILENIKTLRKDLNSLSERTLSMFEKTTGLLKDYQRSTHDLGDEIREIREISELQNERFREVMSVVQSLGLSTMEGDRLRRFRSQQRLVRRLESPLDTYSSLSSQYRRRRHDPESEAHTTTVEEEEENQEGGPENSLYECMVPKSKRPTS